MPGATGLLKTCNDYMINFVVSVFHVSLLGGLLSDALRLWRVIVSFVIRESLVAWPALVIRLFF